MKNQCSVNLEYVHINTDPLHKFFIVWKRFLSIRIKLHFPRVQYYFKNPPTPLKKKISLKIRILNECQKRKPKIFKHDNPN